VEGEAAGWRFCRSKLRRVRGAQKRQVPLLEGALLIQERTWKIRESADEKMAGIIEATLYSGGSGLVLVLKMWPLKSLNSCWATLEGFAMARGMRQSWRVWEEKGVVVCCQVLERVDRFLMQAREVMSKGAHQGYWRWSGTSWERSFHSEFSGEKDTFHSVYLPKTRNFASSLSRLYTAEAYSFTSRFCWQWLV
jgi:hypothetical protein